VARVFISYAAADRAVAYDVSGGCGQPATSCSLITTLAGWISLGEDWKRRLYRELHEVDAVIGVVTRSFVSSEWCFAELGIADARGCRLIPLLAEVGVVHPLMRDL
jgi:TIR domain